MSFGNFHTVYSPKNVSMRYCGVELNEGKGEDVFLTIKRNNPRISFAEGVDGMVAPSINPIQSVRYTITLFTTSEACQKLTNLYQALVLLDNGIGGVAGFDKLVALPFTVTDPSGSTLMWAEQAVLEEVGDNSLGLAVGTRDFTFYAPHGLEVNIDGTELAVLKSDIEKEMSKQ